MTVLVRGLVFQPVLVTQTCTYKSKNITLILQIFHLKKKKKKKRKRKKEKNLFQKEHNNPPPSPKPLNNNNKRSHNTSECFDMSLELGKLQVKKNDKGHNQMTNIIEST